MPGCMRQADYVSGIFMHSLFYSDILTLTRNFYYGNKSACTNDKLSFGQGMHDRQRCRNFDKDELNIEQCNAKLSFKKISAYNSPTKCCTKMLY